MASKFIEKDILGTPALVVICVGAWGKSVEEERTFWNNLKTVFFDILTEICLRLRLNHSSYGLIEDIMSLLYPRDKDIIRNMVQSAIKELEVPPVKDIRFVHYDEQHPRRDEIGNIA
jgi:hypothetical protein